MKKSLKQSKIFTAALFFGMKKIFFLYFLWLIGLSGCVSTETVVSNHVDPADVYQSYSVFGNREKTNLNAFFRVGGSGGTTVELIEPSKVKYNGSPLSKIPPNFLKGTSYAASEDGYRPAHEIFFTDTDGKDYRFNLTLEPIEFQPKAPVVLSRSQTNLIPLNRIPDDSGEKFELILTNEEFQKLEKNQITVDLPKTFDKVKNALVIPPDVLKKFPVSAATIDMTTSKSLSLAQFSKAGGNFTVNYEAAHLKIQIAD